MLKLYNNKFYFTTIAMNFDVTMNSIISEFLMWKLLYKVSTIIIKIITMISSFINFIIIIIDWLIDYLGTKVINLHTEAD